MFRPSWDIIKDSQIITQRDTIPHTSTNQLCITNVKKRSYNTNYIIHVTMANSCLKYLCLHLPKSTVNESSIAEWMRFL